MKRCILLIFAVFFSAASLSAAGTKFILTAHGNYFFLAKNDYTQQSDKKKIFFDGKVAVTIHENYYLWGSYGVFPLKDEWTNWSSKAVFEKDLDVKRVLKKRVIAGGFGFFLGYFQPNEFSVRGEIGICGITNGIDISKYKIGTDEFLENLELKQSSIGVKGNLCVAYGFFRNFFVEAAVSYMYAPDTVDEIRANLGGINVSFGLGICL